MKKIIIVFILCFSMFEESFAYTEFAYSYSLFNQIACDSIDSLNDMWLMMDNDKYSGKLMTKKEVKQLSRNRCILLFKNDPVIALDELDSSHWYGTINVDGKKYVAVLPYFSKDKQNFPYQKNEVVVIEKTIPAMICKNALVLAKNMNSIVGTKEDDSGCIGIRGEQLTIIDFDIHRYDLGVIKIKRNNGDVYWIDESELLKK